MQTLTTLKKEILSHTQNRKKINLLKSTIKHFKIKIEPEKQKIPPPINMQKTLTQIKFQIIQ